MPTTEVEAAAPYSGLPTQRPLTRDEIDLIKDVSFKGASDLELKLFVAVCNQKQLNPLSHQIYAVKRYDTQLGREVVTFQVGIDGFRLTAERSGKYRGIDGPYWCGPDGKWCDVWLDRLHPPAAAKVGVYKDGFAKPLFAVALFAEYAQLTKAGDLNAIWRRRPAGQIAKCAEALALRQSFPEELSGLYSTDELSGQQDNQPEASPVPASVPSAPASVSLPAPAPGAIPIAPVPDAVLLMWAKMTNIKAVCEVCAELKKWLIELAGENGEREYYAILKQYGNAEHANQLKQRGARVTVHKLWDAVQKAEMLRPEPTAEDKGFETQAADGEVQP